MKYRFPILISALCVALVCADHVSSQSPIDLTGIVDPNTGLPVGVEEQVSLVQIPKIPKPGETVSVRIDAYTTNLNKAKITWTQDGKVITSQIGAVSMQFQAPVSGKSSTITITIVKENGGTLIRTVTLSPADVDLIYEADTYAHPFFKGKKHFTSESIIKFIAIPNFVTAAGRKIPDSELVYTWKVDGTTQQNMSGYGKSTFVGQGNLIERPQTVTVEVSAVNSPLTATQSLNIRSIQPELVVYENNPLLGVVYEKAIQGSFLLERPQVDFEGVPYFFSSPTKDGGNLSYQWMINGVTITSKTPNENYLLLRNDSGEEGTAQVSGTVKHVQKLLQTTGTQLKLDFKKEDNTSTNESFTF